MNSTASTISLWCIKYLILFCMGISFLYTKTHWPSYFMMEYWRICGRSPPSPVLVYFPQVRDELKANRPSEVQIPVEEVQNSCRLVLRPPNPRGLPSDQISSSRALQGPRGLLILTTVLLLSRLIMTEWMFRNADLLQLLFLFLCALSFNVNNNDWVCRSHLWVFPAPLQVSKDKSRLITVSPPIQNIIEWVAPFGRRVYFFGFFYLNCWPVNGKVRSLRPGDAILNRAMYNVTLTNYCYTIIQRYFMKRFNKVVQDEQFINRCYLFIFFLTA